MKFIGYLFFIILVILGITFAVMNAAPVKINYYVAVAQVPLSLLLIISFAAGIVLGLVVILFKVWRLRFANVRLRRQVSKYKKEIAAIRSIAQEEKDE